jgi:3-oxoacyl-[acyl-carrier protein] reductase
MDAGDKILVVGGSAGIGLAVAKAFGERAVVWSRSTGVDATDAAAVARAKDEFVALHGAPFALVHTVGDFAEERLLDASRATYDQLVASNLTSVFEIVRAVVPAMVAARRGRVVLFAAAGAGGGRAMTRAPVYFALKAAVVQLARSLAAEVAKAGILVNVVSPGLIEHAASHHASQRRLLARVPLGRMGHVDDVVGLVRWLLSDEAGYVTGQDFTVDGGLQL